MPYDVWSDSINLPYIAQKIKEKPNLKAYLSFGGWTLSEHFTAMASRQWSR